MESNDGQVVDDYDLPPIMVEHNTIVHLRLMEGMLKSFYFSGLHIRGVVGKLAKEVFVFKGPSWNLMECC